MIKLLYLLAVSLLGDSTSSIDFDTQIVPVLTKSGCNAGSCHGAAAGRGGLHLSLFGSDATSDYAALAQQFEGRRVNLVRAEESLVLRKPLEELEHGGGLALDEDGAELLLQWIRQGAQRSESKRLVEFSIVPNRIMLSSSQATVVLRATGTFSDGTERDVTRWTQFVPSDPNAAAIDSNAFVSSQRPGRHTIIARFLDRVEAIQISRPFDANDKFELNTTGQRNPIDRYVTDVLNELHLPASPPASDLQWLRRVSLDLTGRLPSIDVAQAFQRDESGADKFERTVDQLLASEGFVDLWTFRFARLLHVHSLPNEMQSYQAYVDWLRSSIRQGVGLDEIARELLEATGDSHEVGPANFSRMVGDARAQAELIGEAFAGVQLGCANCHNHPLDRWTQDDFHGLASIFAKVDRSRHVRWLTRGSVANPRTGQPATPRIPGRGDLIGDVDERRAVVDWLLDDQDNLLAKSMVNRMWNWMFGRGLIDPVDDLRQTNPATHPDLLRFLTGDFVAHGFSLKHTLRQIALSDTYRRSGPNDSNLHDSMFYSHSLRRPLDLEQYVDAVADVLDVQTGNTPVADRALRMIDPVVPAAALDPLGRCRRADCDQANAMQTADLSVSLHLLNGPLINARLVDHHGRLQRLIDSGKSTPEIVQHFYWAAFTRPPTAEELKRWEELLTAGDQTTTLLALQDFVWALLTSQEFCENH